MNKPIHLRRLILLGVILITYSCNSSKMRLMEDAFHRAVSNGDVNAVLFYLKSGVNVNNYDIDGYTALWKATRSENFELVKLLINNNANVNLRNNDTRKYDMPPSKDTPIIPAIFSRNLSLLKYLLQHGANSNMEELYLGGGTPLYYAIIHYKKESRANDIEIIRTLLEHEANPNGRGGLFGEYPLYDAIMIDMQQGSGNYEIVRLLLDYHVNTDIRSRYYPKGEHILVYAMKRKDYELLKLLVRNGANLNAPAYTRNDEGTVLEYSSKLHNPVISNILNSATVKSTVK